MRLSPYSLHESNISGVRAIFNMDACLISSVCAGRYPIDRGCDCCCGDQSLHWTLSRASALLCGCHSHVGGQVCSPVVGTDAPRFISELLFEVGETGALLLGEKPLSVPLQNCPLCGAVTSHAGSQVTLFLAMPLILPQLEFRQWTRYLSDTVLTKSLAQICW